MPRDHQAATAAPAEPTTVDPGVATQVVPRLVGLANELRPFLDAFGNAYCGIPARGNQAHTTLPLADSRVGDLLLYRYHEAFGNLPAVRQITQALALVRGCLWHSRDSHARSQPRPVVRLISEAAKSRNSWVGSADEMLTLLENLEQEMPVLTNGESLPESPDALGVELGKCGLELRENNIELYRPKRRDIKRLWAWRALNPDADTSDTMAQASHQDVSGQTSRSAGQVRLHDTSDTSRPAANQSLTDEQKRLMQTFALGGRNE
jgi:hypothetical protein